MGPPPPQHATAVLQAMSGLQVCIPMIGVGVSGRRVLCVLADIHSVGSTSAPLFRCAGLAAST